MWHARLTLLVVLQLLLQLGDQTSLLVVVSRVTGQGSGGNTGSGRHVRSVTVSVSQTGTGSTSTSSNTGQTSPSPGLSTGQTGVASLEVLLSGHAVTDDTLVRRRLGSTGTTSSESGSGPGTCQTTRGESTGGEAGSVRVGVGRVVVTDSATDDGNVRSGPLSVSVVSSNDGDVGSGPLSVSVVTVSVVTVSLGGVGLVKGRSSDLLAVEIVVTGSDDPSTLPLHVSDGASRQSTQRVVPRSIVRSVGSHSLGVGLEGGRTSVSSSDPTLARGGVPSVGVVSVRVVVVSGLGDVGSGGTGRGSVTLTGSVEVVVGGVRAGQAGSRGEARGGSVGGGGGRGGRTETVRGGGRGTSEL